MTSTTELLQIELNNKTITRINCSELGAAKIGNLTAMLVKNSNKEVTSIYGLLPLYAFHNFRKV